MDSGQCQWTAVNTEHKSLSSRREKCKSTYLCLTLRVKPLSSFSSQCGRFSTAAARPQYKLARKPSHMSLFYLAHHFLFGMRSGPRMARLACLNSTLLRLTGESCGTSEVVTITVLDLSVGRFGRCILGKFMRATQVVRGNRDSFTIHR